mmetsp:Transcript_2975/g.6496  ORF Transcript_2975/g.6496 Transcript_2975/m.6496 type:complete len:222 (+) Transcript_2975:895-1560(+)
MEPLPGGGGTSAPTRPPRSSTARTWLPDTGSGCSARLDMTSEPVSRTSRKKVMPGAASGSTAGPASTTKGGTSAGCTPRLYCARVWLAAACSAASIRPAFLLDTARSPVLRLLLLLLEDGMQPLPLSCVHEHCASTCSHLPGVCQQHRHGSSCEVHCQGLCQPHCGHRGAEACSLQLGHPCRRADVSTDRDALLAAQVIVDGRLPHDGCCTTTGQLTALRR